jgi:hypothetical protein
MPHGFFVVVVVVGVVVVGRGVVVVVVVVTGTAVVVESVVVVVLLDVVVVVEVVVLEPAVDEVVLVVVIALVGCSLPLTTTTPTGGMPCGCSSVIIPLMVSAATAAPISAPIANRPEPPSSVSIWPEYRVHSFGSSRTTK